jgi:hypothetical protein
MLTYDLVSIVVISSQLIARHLGYMNFSFSCGEHYVVQKFYNLPSNIVISMVFGVFFTFKSWNNNFMASKFVNDDLIAKAKNNNKLQKTFLIFFPTTS